MQMLAAIKFFYTPTYPSSMFVEIKKTEIQHLPNLSAYLQIETPNGPSSQMVLF